MPPRSWKEYSKKRRSIPPPDEFIGVDGEGIETTGGQKYALLSSSLHNPIYDPQGLPTERCLRFLLDLKTKPRQQLVSFAFSYDANMLLKDLPADELRELYEKERCWYRCKECDYRIARRKGKSLRVSEYTKDITYLDRGKKVRSVVVWDSFGFFQGSFLRAIADFKIKLSIREWRILIGEKRRRGTFIEDERQRLEEYNHLECDVLVKLMESLQSLLRGLDLYLKRWDGAGAIAAALMEKYGVKKHVYRGYSEEVEDGLMRAYFGGRSQCVQFGVFEGPIYNYDINSSYPSSYLDLPTLHGKWSISDRYLPNEKYVLYQLEWNIPHKAPITPFPYRDNIGSIRYPHQGRGIYHSILVDVAMKHFGKYIKIEKAWVFTPDTNEKPFEWVKPFMEERLRLKAVGDQRHVPMKLGANSIYGKTAQGLSYGDDLPPYQSYFWAGLITAWTHAQLLKVAMEAPDKIIFFGTDSIFSQIPLHPPLGKTLGTWEDCGKEGDRMIRFDLFQPGLYRIHHKGRKPKIKTRGFRREEVDFDALCEVWEKRKWLGEYSIDVTRFQGLEVCQAQNRMGQWGSWVKLTKKIKLSPGGWGTVNEKAGTDYLHRGLSADNYRFTYFDGGKTLSARFEKKNLHLPDPDDEIGMSVYLSESEFLDNPELD